MALAVLGDSLHSNRCPLGLFMKTAEEIEFLLHAVYPQTKDRFRILRVQEEGLSMVMHVQVEDLRPGNTISGPSMFTLADCAFYALILGVLNGQVEAVTTNISINLSLVSGLTKYFFHIFLIIKVILRNN